MSAIIPDPEDIGKLFVGGLSSTTTKETLYGYFSQFGEVVDSVVMKNNETGRSRGFGFVTFKDPNCMFKALQIKSHELDGKKIDPKECTPRSMQKTRKQVGKCKVFLGGLPPDITEDAIRHGMSKYGKVDQVVIMVDQESKKCRGFGFLSFELEESIDRACAERYVNINGKQIECKRAEPRVNPKRFMSAYPKIQNGIAAQASYAQVAPVQQNSWNMSPHQAVYNMAGNSYASYPNYTAGMVPFSPTAPCYPNLPTIQYTQPYPPSYGSYSYSPVPAATYPQTSFPVDPAATSLSGPTVAFNAEAAKVSGSSDYSPQTSSYGPIKSVLGANNASDVPYSNQVVMPSVNFQRYHPYKV